MSQTQTVGSHKTTVCEKQGVLSVVYHNTEVVRADSDTITLNTGGWKTVTTKTRMNQAANQFDLDYSVFQKSGKWYVDYNGATIPFDGASLILPRK